MAYVKRIDLDVETLPLRRPYVLSFVTLDAFEAVLARVHLDDGMSLVGEVVPLPGYTPETVEAVRSRAVHLVPELEGREASQARTRAARSLDDAPLARSLFLSAFDSREMLNGPLEPSARSVPVVFATSSRDEELVKTVERATREGFGTIKVKVGEVVARDVEAVRRLDWLNETSVRLRFDANQGYSLDEALRFLDAVETHVPQAVELMEQPFRADGWRETEKLAARTSVPLMLDESILSEEDARRARDCGCQWIKLKLCKQGGLEELRRLARAAKAWGLKVVLGNGVATDVSNLLELWLFAGNRALFDGASESTGFAKLDRRLQHETLSIREGHAVW
jgi:L-alanine-DL-glutamate epimerase-like enolase superfamily enzyme